MAFDASNPGWMEYVRTEAGEHVRFVGANGEKVAVTEPYTGGNPRESCDNAVQVVKRIIEAGDIRFKDERDQE